MELGIMEGNTYGRIVGMKEDEPETLEMTQKSSGVTYTVNSHLQCLDCPTCDNDGSVTHPSLPSFYLLIVEFGSFVCAGLVGPEQASQLLDCELRCHGG